MILLIKFKMSFCIFPKMLLDNWRQSLYTDTDPPTSKESENIHPDNLLFAFLFTLPKKS